MRAESGHSQTAVLQMFAPKHVFIVKSVRAACPISTLRLGCSGNLPTDYRFRESLTVSALFLRRYLLPGTDGLLLLVTFGWLLLTHSQ